MLISAKSRRALKSRHRNHFCLHVPYSSNFYWRFGIVIDLLKFFLCVILVSLYECMDNEVFSSCLDNNSYVRSAMFNDTVNMNVILQSTLSLNGHLYKTDTSVKRTLELVPAFLYSFYLTPYKTDTSLRWTLSAGPKRVRLRESWLFKPIKF